MSQAEAREESLCIESGTLLASIAKFVCRVMESTGGAGVKIISRKVSYFNLNHATSRPLSFLQVFYESYWGSKLL